MKSSLLLLPAAVFYLCACGGASYTPPSMSPTTQGYQIAGPKDKLYDTTVAVLEALGFTLRVADREAGSLQTEPLEMKFSLDQCDCGIYLKHPLAADPRTTLTAVYDFQISEGAIRLGSKIIGVQKKRNGRVDRELECVSSGDYEKMIMQKIAGRLIRK